MRVPRTIRRRRRGQRSDQPRATRSFSVARAGRTPIHVARLSEDLCEVVESSAAAARVRSFPAAMELMPDRIILPEQVQVLRLRDRDP
jgi:hypothetical protein